MAVVVVGYLTLNMRTVCVRRQKNAAEALIDITDWHSTPTLFCSEGDREKKEREREQEEAGKEEELVTNRYAKHTISF